MKKDTPITPRDLTKIYLENIRCNLNTLIDVSQNRLKDILENAGLNINQGNISKYLNGKQDIPLSFIIKICELYNISIIELASSPADFQQQHIYASNNNILAYPVILGKQFTTNPNDGEFNGYLQKYYCYFFPTLSNEDKLLTGELELNNKQNYCQALFTLKTNSKSQNQPITKHYCGYAMLSKMVGACYIILGSDDEGELNFISFRHFTLRHQLLDCRMAIVLTTSAGERHFPTAHRMLLSRTPIEDIDLQTLQPHLHLNDNRIQIDARDLEELRQISKEYTDIINHILARNQAHQFYEFREDFIISNAQQFLSKSDLHIFLSDLRSKANNARYNKVSNKLDENVRNYLLSRGYYNDTKI